MPGNAVLYVRVSNEVKDALNDVARDHGVSLTAVTGRALAYYLEKRCGWSAERVGQLP